MHGFDFATGTLALPVWAVGAAAALVLVLLVLVVFAFLRTGRGRVGSLIGRFALVLVGAAVLWVFFERAELRERTADRRVLDQRITELAARATAPGSALACLDATAGDTVETACEKAVFASPEATATAVSYVAARLALLADATQFAKRADAAYEGALAMLRQAIESDRFGIAAHVLSVRDSCTPLLCDSFALLHDASRVQANLKERVFDGYVARYTAEWAARAQKPATPVAETPTTYTTASAPPPPAPAAAPVPLKYDFPSAASIPPVSIMTPEPGAAPETKQAATPPASTPLPPRRPQPARAPAPSARANAAPPQPLTPPAQAPAAR